MKVSEISPSNPKHWSGGVQSKDHDYSYGYFEIRAKLSGFYNNGQPTGEGFWPAFWTYYIDVKDTSTGCYITHREIDILEPSGKQYADSKTNVSGWWTNQITNNCPLKYGEYYFHSPTPLFIEFHKYAVEWLPHRIVFYFDDEPYFVSYNDNSVPDLSHFVVIDQQLQGGNWPLNPNTPMPSYMTIDYFHYYQLKKDCSTNAFINNNTDLSNFDYAVKNNITIGTGSTFVYLNIGEIKTFRAVNEITIYGDFTVPLGCELNLIPTPCN